MMAKFLQLQNGIPVSATVSKNDVANLDCVSQKTVSINLSNTSPITVLSTTSNVTIFRVVLSVGQFGSGSTISIGDDTDNGRLVQNALLSNSGNYILVYDTFVQTSHVKAYFNLTNGPINSLYVSILYYE